MTRTRDRVIARQGETAAHVLADVARELAGTLDVGQASERVVSAVRRLFGVRVSVLYHLDPVSDSLTCVAAAGGANPRKWLGMSLSVGEGVAGRAVAKGRAIWSGDVLADRRIKLPEWVRVRLSDEGHGSVAGVPLRTREKTLGALLLADRAGRVFTEGDLRLLSAFADQAALTLENARLYAKTQRGLRETEILLAVSQAVGSTLDPTEMMRRVARETARAIGADMAGAYLPDADEEFLRPIAGYRVPKHLLDAFVKFPIPVRGHDFLEGAWREARPVFSDDAETDPRIDRETLARFPHRSVLFVPMIVKGTPIGGLFLIWWEAKHRFTADELRLVEGISRQSALAIDNARLYEEARRALADLKALQEELVRAETLRATADLAAGIAHHVNNLLAVILARTQILLRRTPGPEIPQALKVIERATLDGADLIRRVQRFSCGRPEAEMELVDLNDLAEQVLEMTRSLWQVQARGVQAAFEPGAIPTVAGHPPSLRELILNLLLNAGEAVPAGGPISVKTWTSEGRVSCSVSDPGAGMSDEVRRRALEPFFTTKGPKRMGLGLSVAYGIVRRHGGELTIESAEGQGSTVTIHLPIATSSGEPLPGPPPAGSRVPAASPGSRGGL